MNHRTDPVPDAYQHDTRLLVAKRVRMATAILLVVCTVGSFLDWRYHPERAVPLLIGLGAYVLVSGAQILSIRRHPALSVPVTIAVFNYVAIGLSIYCGLVHARTELLVNSLALLVTGTAVVFPWGVRSQLWASAGAPVSYFIALALGATPTLPIPYELFALLTAVLVGVVGASVVDRSRFSTFTLLNLGRALDATINDPDALAMQITEQARQGLGADWAVLYQKDADEPVFRLAGFSGLPDTVASELRALDFAPTLAPDLARRLRRSETVELVRAKNDPNGLTSLLQRWGASTALLQVIQRQEEIIAVLACASTAARRFPAADRALLTAIANQASVALYNAQLIEETRRANRLKSEFLATVSHELRTPLSVMTGYTDILLESTGDLSDGEQRDILLRIRDQANQLNDLIQAMLDLNRLDTRRLPITITAFTIDALIAGLRSNLPASWCRDGVLVRWDVKGEEIVLQSDRGKLEMILRNLIHNALKYTDVGSVTISAAPHPSEAGVVFTVTDTGPGIAPEDQTAIFEMFRQASHTAPRGGGVGLGLYIVKRLTEALGGQVSLDSEQGKGARVTVSLPMEPPRPPAV